MGVRWRVEIVLFDGRRERAWFRSYASAANYSIDVLHRRDYEIERLFVKAKNYPELDYGASCSFIFS